jgi:hypothetical protein
LSRLGEAQAADLAHCDQKVAQLQATISVLKRDLDNHLTQDERFQRAQPDPQSEGRLKPELARLLGLDGGASWTVECRARICKLDLLLPSGAADGWRRSLQDDQAIQKIATGWGFTAPVPTTDPLTRQPLTRHTIDITVNDEDAADAAAIIAALVDGFRRSGAVSDCTRGYAEVGTVEASVRLGLDPETPPQFEFHFGGSLEPTPSGQCIESRLRAAAAAIALPARVNGAIASVTFSSPPP